MRNIFISFVLSLSALLSSCVDHASAPPLLVQADSAYMRGDYQRADSLLDAFSPNLAADAEEPVRMYAKLLGLCRLFVRAEISGENLMLADSLVRYYSRHGHRSEYVKSLIFLGDAYRKGYNYPSALDCYLNASRLADASGDNMLLLWSEKNIGTLYLDQRMLDDCIPHYLRSYDASRAMRDTLRMAHLSYRMGIVSTIKNQPDSAIHYYKQTIVLGRNTCQKGSILSAANYKLSDIYIQLGEYDEACKYMSREPLDDYNWAYWHYGQHHFDSAAYYFHRAYNHEALRGRVEILQMLGQIEHERGHLALSLDYYIRHVSLADSLQKQDRQEETQRVQAQFNNEQIKSELDSSQRKAERLQAFVIISVLVMLLFAVVSWSFFKSYRYRKVGELEQERRLKLLEHQKYLQSERRIEENNRRIATLEQQLVEARRHNDAEAISRIEIDAQSYRMENSSIQHKKEQQELLRRQFVESDLYKKVRYKYGTGDVRLSEEEWSQLQSRVDRIYDDFSIRLQSLCTLSDMELRTCCLLKVGVSANQIAVLQFRTVAAISMLRKRLYKKLTRRDGSAQDLDSFIMNF